MPQISHQKRHARSHRFHLAFYLVVALSVLAGAGVLEHVADAAPLRVRVRGSAKLVARASRDQVAGQGGVSELVLSGSLADDAGQPLALQQVSIRVTRETDPHDANVADGIRHAHACGSSSDSVPSTPASRPTAWGVSVSG